MPFEIVEKEEMAAGVWKMVIAAPDVAKAAKAGQFVIVRAYVDSERIPLTIAGIDKENGTIMMSVQALGKGTKQITKMNVGESLADFAGPLGTPADVKKIGTVILVGGGVGIQILQARSEHRQMLKRSERLSWSAAASVLRQSIRRLKHIRKPETAS